MRQTSSLTPEDEIASKQLYLMPYENSENDTIIHRGKRN